MRLLRFVKIYNRTLMPFFYVDKFNSSIFRF